jgi:hypothetical protein
MTFNLHHAYYYYSKSVLLFSTEKEAIEAYFANGHTYKVILMFLSLYHNITMSLRTLKRRLKHYGLFRRKSMSTARDIWEAIHAELQGPGILFLSNTVRPTYSGEMIIEMSIRYVRDPSAFVCQVTN